MPDLSKELIEQARHLANREPTRPRQASLRRAVSAAYYALFHALGAELGRRFARELRPAVGRLLDHGPARGAADQIDRLVAEGLFEGEPVELLEGVLVGMSPEGAEHAWAQQRLSVHVG